MATVPYVTASPWWSAANFNTLVGEFDRRLTRALAGKTPYLLANYGVGDASVASAARKWFLPIAATSSDPTEDGVFASDGVMGACFVFTGEAAPVVYFAETTPFDQDAVDTDADAASETSRDGTAKVMVVDDTALDRSLDWSLKALTRTDAPDTFWLAPESSGGRRAMRRHQYAVAEILLEGLDEFTLPRDWDRFQCFRLHNFSPVEVTVTVETINADGSPGDDIEVTLPKFGCKAIRRAQGYYDATWTYFWKARARLDKRFYNASGGGVPEASAAANPISRINVIADWMTRLGAQRDPYVDPPDETSRYASLFGDPSEDTTKIHDLIAHRGACKSIGWDSSNDPVETAGTIGLSDTLETDLAAVGVELTDDGDTYTLDRADDAEGEESKGLDLFAMGSNIMLLPAGTVTIPGVSPFAQDERQRQYHTLPVTLLEDIPLDSIASPHWTGFTSSGSGTASITRTLYGDTSIYGTGPVYGGSWYSGDGYTVKRLSEVGDAGGEITKPSISPHSSVGEWLLTPFGFAAQWSYSYTFVSGIPSGPSSDFEPLNGGIYQRWSGVTVQRKAWVHIVTPGWAMNSWKPTSARAYGKQEHDAGGPGTWLTADWSGELSDPDGAEPTATGKLLLDYADLRYLSDGTPATEGDVFDRDGFGAPVNVAESRYQVTVDPDEAKSVVDDLVYSRREQFNKGLPTVESGDDPPVYFLRRRMQIEDYNGLAWMVNGWTRTKPLVSIRNVWLMRTDDGAYPGIFIPELDWPYNCFPVEAAFHFEPGAWATEWTKANMATFLPVLDREDLPEWTAAHEANGWEVDANVNITQHLVNKTFDSLLGTIFGDEYFTATSPSRSESRNGAIAVSELDNDPDDPDFAWCRISDVIDLAESYGLPFFDVAWGHGRRLMARYPIGYDGEALPHPFDGEEFRRRDGIVLGFSDGDPPPDLSDEANTTLSVFLPPAGLARYVPAEDADACTYIEGGRYEVDGNGVPQQSPTVATYNRGTPTIAGNIYEVLPPSPITVADPYYPTEDALALATATDPIVARAHFTGYDEAEINGRFLLLNAYTRALTDYSMSGSLSVPPITGSRTGGSWSYTGTVSAVDIGSGLTFHLPSAVSERPVRIICDLYVDLAAE